MAAVCSPKIGGLELDGSLKVWGRRTIYFMGIIDILTPYDEMKKLEHRFKAKSLFL